MSKINDTFFHTMECPLSMQKNISGKTIDAKLRNNVNNFVQQSY